MTSYRMVRILWTDAQGDCHGWTPVSEIDSTPCVVTTVGHLIEPAPRANHYTVALSFYGGHDGTERQADSVCHIPAGMVHVVTDLTTLPVLPTV